jgi:hypothetical protein
VKVSRQCVHEAQRDDVAKELFGGALPLVEKPPELDA